MPSPSPSPTIHLLPTFSQKFRPSLPAPNPGPFLNELCNDGDAHDPGARFPSVTFASAASNKARFRPSHWICPPAHVLGFLLVVREGCDSAKDGNITCAMMVNGRCSPTPRISGRERNETMRPIPSISTIGIWFLDALLRCALIWRFVCHCLDGSPCLPGLAQPNDFQRDGEKKKKNPSV